MKRKLLVIIVLVTLFLLFIFIRFFVLDRQNASGKIKILSSPAATVFINNVAVGKTPYENSNQKVGEYEVKLIPDEKDKNTVTWDGKIPVYKNTLTYVSRELGTSDLTSAGEILTVVEMEKKPNGSNGEIQIETEPSGAIVYLDNDEKGVAPISLQDVPQGDHELAVYLPGFFRRAQKIKVEKGFAVQASFKLALDQTHKTLEEELAREKKEASEAAKKKAEEEKKLSPTKSADEEEDTTSTVTGARIEVLDNEVGYLNVRSEPSVDGEVVVKINPGEEYNYTDEQDGWYFITLDDGSEGWVSGDYVNVLE